MKQAKVPFQFVNSSYLIRISANRANTLGELAQNLHSCSDASIFYHTFQSLERQHYTVFSNDFAQWTQVSCNEAPLAERLASIDIRDFTYIGELRDSLVVAVDEYVRVNPSATVRPSFEPFYFCEAFDFAVPEDRKATNLVELEEGIRNISLQTLHHQFINSRLRLHLRTNDFSHWIENSLGLPELAAQINRIDIYVNTLEDIRNEIVQTIHSWINR
ncbi:MAG: DUF5752 family protein [Candidatus Acidiferrales bacterium]